MTKKHQIAINHNNTGGLEDITPQPFVSGVKANVYYYGGDAAQYSPEDSGLYVELKFSGISGAAFEDLLLQFGIYDDTVESREVTLKTRWTRTIYRKYNGLVHRPILDVDYKLTTGDIVRDLTITVSDLEQI